ncbi:MAG: transglutaminase domain-containing protein [Acutalibacteraceae bacterium]
MKKITIQISIILCLSLFVSLFTGCGKSDITDLFSSAADSSSDVSQSGSDSGLVSSEITGDVNNGDKDFADISDFETVKAEDFYCYNRLNENQKKAYNIIHDLVVNYSGEEAKIYGVNDGDVALAYYAVRADNPQLFWMSNEYAVGMSSDGSYAVVSVSGEDYGFITSGKEEMQAKNERLLKAVGDVISSVVTKGMTGYEAELALHDWLCENVSYNQAAADNMTKDQMENLTAYGALVNRSAVCEGYSRAFQLLLYYVGINSTTIIGTAGGDSHMWNAVQLDDGWYYTDVTWDDSAKSELEYTHANFNLSAELILKNHKMSPDASEIRDASKISSGDFNLFYEDCVSLTYNYYTVKNQVIAGSDIFNDIVTAALKSSWDGTCAAAEFRYDGYEASTSQIRNDCTRFKIVDQMADYTGKTGGVLGYSVMSGYGTFVIKFS